MGCLSFNNLKPPMDNAVKAPAINAICPNGKDLKPKYIKAIFTENISRNHCIFMSLVFKPA